MNGGLQPHRKGYLRQNNSFGVRSGLISLKAIRLVALFPVLKTHNHNRNHDDKSCIRVLRGGRAL